jgi:hypothetical protein
VYAPTKVKGGKLNFRFKKFLGTLLILMNSLPEKVPYFQEQKGATGSHSGAVTVNKPSWTHPFKGCLFSHLLVSQ